jgi:hypothetical protein
MNVFLSKDRAGFRTVITNERQHRVGEKACQSKIFWSLREQKVDI